MLNHISDLLDSQGQALTLRADRQRLLASNIANADTPGFVARDLQFADALKAAQGGSLTPRLAQTSGTHMNVGQAGTQGTLVYATPSQPRLDGNTVDLDRERASFADNAIRYEASLRFINQHVRTMLTAIQGQ